MNAPPPEGKLKYIENFLDVAKAAAVLLALVWSLVYLFCNLTSQILVEPVSVPKIMAESGLSDVASQRALVTALQTVMSDARETMPGEITDEIQVDEPAVSLLMPETGISLQGLIQGTKKILHIKDVTIRATILENAEEAPAAKKGQRTDHVKTTYIARVYVTEPSTDIEDQTTPPSDPLGTLRYAALSIMKMHNKFIYASALATRDRTDCYKKHKCDFKDAIDAFKGVLQDGAMQRYHRWSWLALSKIDEDQGRYADETAKALLAVREDKHLSWAYYNWGVGLSEQGCDEEALEAFERARKYRPLSGFMNNAAGRQALILAMESKGRDKDNGDAQRDYLKQAVGFLTAATQLQHDYFEAYLNLARTLKAASAENDAMRAAGKSAGIPVPEDIHDTLDTVLLGDSVQVVRADFFSLSWDGLRGGRADSKDRRDFLTSTLNRFYDNSAECGKGGTLADTILEAKGCLSRDDEQVNSMSGERLVRARQTDKAWPKKDACRTQSVKANIKDDDLPAVPIN